MNPDVHSSTIYKCWKTRTQPKCPSTDEWIQKCGIYIHCVQLSHDATYTWNPKKNDTNELIYKTETDSDTEDKLITKREGGRDKLGVWDYQIHTTIYKIDKQKGFTV